ncbi:NAD(P)-binding protein [Hymenopellis radicata]|nr:NAD(P)-binding protein [Hymenopellis radicata]
MSASPRVWFVTGTSSGLGKAILETVLASGEYIAATSRNAAGLSKLQEKYPKQLLPVELDLTNQEDVASALRHVVQHFGRIDVVVNNAGTVVFGEVEGIPLADARYLFEVQFWGPVFVMREPTTFKAIENLKIARIFRQQETGGYLFNISAPGGYRSNPVMSYYQASKFALEGFTQAFFKEMDPSWNIKGAIIQPGGFESEWRGSSATTIPIHPAYDTPTNPAALFRQIVAADYPYLGSPSRMAEVRLVWHTTSDSQLQAIFKLASEPRLPFRIQLGTDSLFLIQSQAQETIRDTVKWAHVALSTDKEDMDGEAYVDILKASPSFRTD